jgi:hypothetical protein
MTQVGKNADGGAERRDLAVALGLEGKPRPVTASSNFVTDSQWKSETRNGDHIRFLPSHAVVPFTAANSSADSARTAVTVDIAANDVLILLQHPYCPSAD